MNTLTNKEDEKALAPVVPMPRSLFGGDIFGRSLFGPEILGRVLTSEMPFTSNNLVHRETKEDGSTVLEYNLAGYSTEHISTRLDTAQNQLIISAKDESNSRRKTFSTVLTLSPYTSPEDISTSYKNGILEVVISPLEKRKEESIVDIPIN